MKLSFLLLICGPCRHRPRLLIDDDDDDRRRCYKEYDAKWRYIRVGGGRWGKGNVLFYRDDEWGLKRKINERKSFFLLFEYFVHDNQWEL